MDHDSEMQRLSLMAWIAMTTSKVNGAANLSSTVHLPGPAGMTNGGWFPPSREPSLEQSNGGHELAFASNPAQPSTSHIPEQSSPSVTTENEPRQKRWSFPKGSGATPKRPDAATSSGKSPLTSRSLAALNGRKISSPRFSEGSSRSGSLLSDVEQRDRIKDLEEDILRQRERRWNKVTPRRSSMTSLHSNSPQSAERHRTQSEHSTTPQFDTPRSETESPSTNRPIRRYNSLTSNRSVSPTGSIHSVHTEDEPDPELVHLRERNWNSPRPVWPQPVGEQQRALSPGIASTGFYSPHARMRTRTMSTSSVETDDSYNPASYTSPPSSRTTYTPNGTPSRPHRRNDSSPSLSQPSSNQSRIPVSPSAIRKRTNSAANLLSPPGQDTGRVRPKTVSMSGVRPDLSPSTSKSLSASPNRNADNPRGVLPRPTKIPVKSPRKAIPVPSKMNGAPPISESLSEWDGPLGASEEQWKSPNVLHLGSDDDLRIQELTPTFRTVAPPPTGSPERSHGTSPLSSEYLDVPRDGDANGLNDSTATVYADPRRFELPTIIDSPPKASSSSLTLEFASPSPPKELPALPDPPSTDDESNDGTGWKGFKPSRLFEENRSLLQTPKAPGAWFDTPAPARRPRSYSDTTLRTPLTQGGLAPPPNGANYSTLQTPKPPGGWLATPTPVKPQYVDQSVETDTEGERDPAPMPALQTGLATPSSSLSKGSRVVQTPAAPGAWVNTPATRKSVMKVRFDPDANETREYSKGESDASGTEGLGSSTNSQATQTLSPPNTPKMESQTVFSSPKKTPTIRVLDAYGNEQTEEAAASPTQAQSVFRVVDALGEAVKEAPLPEDIDQSIVIPAESRDELLSRVRRGLDDLVSDMHDIDRASALSSSELTRVKQLDSASLQAREKRRRLSSDYKKNNSQFKDRFDSLRASMQRNVGSDPSTSSGGKWHFTSPRFFFLVLLQIVLAVVMYRSLSDSRVEELFKTAYYDPFEPHLYQHIFKSRLILSTSPERHVSWLSLLDLLQEQGIKACVLQTRDNLSITLANVQSFVWERFGDDGSYFNISWPPT
ncbi:hypothetical protein FA13DRAFT_914503 [Coprinellus micaceus]|uniref:Uncharacterized protein n=1 Tax=Coprinellus micaceus TaxID=71717 RepID=A0A4Y7TTM5_COPMI|nr:hypothetical protein FA13DRAFT_914503 [Coprinellus micaceus]